jgi:hypothetical protein
MNKKQYKFRKEIRKRISKPPGDVVAAILWERDQAVVT